MKKNYDSLTKDTILKKENHKFRKFSIFFTLNFELRYATLHTVPECYKLQLS